MSSPNWPSLRRLFAAVGVLEEGDFEEIFQQIRLTKEDIHQLVLESGAMKDGLRHAKTLQDTDESQRFKGIGARFFGTRVYK